MNPQLQTVLQEAFHAFQLGNLLKAEEMLRGFVNNVPNSFDAHHLLGIVYASQDKHQEAIACYKNAFKYNLNDPSALSNCGVSLSAIGKIEEALSMFKKSLDINPDAPNSWYNAGNTLCDLGKYKEALFYYQKSININPEDERVHNNYGRSLFELNQYFESLTYFDRALEINQFFPDCLINKGEALRKLGCYEEAITHVDKALSLNPDYAEGWSNKGLLLHELKRFDEAIIYYDRALSIKPDYAAGWSNKGSTLNELKRYEEAIIHYDKALTLKPNIDWVAGDLLHTKLKICSWLGLAESLKDISKKLVANEKVITPFPLLVLNDDSLLHKKSSEIYIQSRHPFNFVLGPILRYPQSKKIRVGYFSADFHNHATGYLMAELFELHDKSQFELVGFSFGPIEDDEMRQRLEKSFDQFIEVGRKSNVEIAKLSRDLNIDIAVDLKGFTHDARTGIFAHRAAPIQVNYLGYPGSLGAEYIDYIIADKTLISPELQSCYSEKVIYLPNSYQVNDRKRLISDRKFTRQELGLPEHGFVFTCFNNNYKILPTTFEGWMRILKAVEGGVLWLLQDNSWAVENLKKEAKKQGIAPDRLVFAERLPLSEHLARQRQADLFLDTFPYNAHTTTSDALWAGLPVLTLMGQSFASRVAASLLNAVGLPELITSTQEEYEALAIELALNPKKLEEIKLKLVNNRMTTPLFDTLSFTKNIESAYINMHGRYHAGLGPDHIAII